MAKIPATEAELRQEQRKVYRNAAAGVVFCAVVLGAVQIFLPRIVQFPEADLESRLTFWAVAALFLLVWVMAGLGMVSTLRRYSAQDIQGSAYSPPSPKIAVPVAFLQNTLEQFVLTAFILLAFILLVGAPAMPFIAATVVLFAIGRITFLRGYPKGAGGRAFGFVVTGIPSLIAFAISLAVIISRVWRYSITS